MFEKCDLYLNKLVLLEKMLMEMFYIILNCEGLLWELVTLCLPIPLVPVMYPWVWVVKKLVSEHWLNSCILICKCLFSFTDAVIRGHHVFDKSPLFYNSALPLRCPVLLCGLNFCLCLFRMRREHAAPAADAAFGNEIDDDQLG